MMSCEGKWHVEGAAVQDLARWKYNAGAAQLIRRNLATFAYLDPIIIATNITPPSIKLTGKVIYFLPDAAFIIDGKNIEAISYGALNLQLEQQQFIENESVPKDAQVISHTWLHPNRRGGPDRRFSTNYQIPICLYETAHLTDNTGLNELFQFSRTGVIKPFAGAIQNLALYSSAREQH
jgi:hypothetical protein